MTKETVASFVLAVCVVGGSMFAFARFGGLGSFPQAHAATQPAPVAAAQQAQAEQTAQTEAQQAQVDAADDEAATPPATGKPRCKAIGHQITGIDGALVSPLSAPVRDFYVKQRKSLQDEQAGLDC
jgi:hypothetical protein